MSLGTGHRDKKKGPGLNGRALGVCGVGWSLRLRAEGLRTGLGAIYASTPNSIPRDSKRAQRPSESPNEFQSSLVSQLLSLRQIRASEL
jgi:hypothetical protein